MWLTDREAPTKTSQLGLARQEWPLSCSTTSGPREESVQQPNYASWTPTSNLLHCMDARHGEGQKCCCRRYRLSSTPVWGASSTSGGLTSSEIKICGNGQHRNQWPSRYWRGSGARPDTPSGYQYSASHAKLWPKTRTGKERGAGHATAGGGTLTEKTRHKAPTEVEWGGKPKTECNEGVSSMDYALLGAMGLSK